MSTLFSPGTDFRSTPDYKGYVLQALNATLIPITTLIFGTRIYVRVFMTKNPGLDDGFAFVAFLFAVGLSSFDLVGVKYGSGAHIYLIPQESLLKFFNVLVTQNLWYFWCTCFVRLAVAAFLPRLSKEKLYLYLVYGIASFTVLQTFVCFLYKLLECKPVSDLWLPPHTPGTKCVSDAANEIMMTINAGFGIFIDCVLLGLPIWIISKKMIMSRKMIQVVAIFCVGIFVVVTGVVRLFYMKTLSFASDPTFHMSTIGVWSDLEAHIGLWCACFPALQPILRIVSFKLGLRTKLLSYGDTPGKKSAGASGHLGGASGVQRSNHGYLRSGNGIDVKGTETDSDSQKGIISKDKSFEMESMGQIHKQTDVQVSVEERQDGHKKVGRQESWIDL
ncbi:hypothetical protein IFR04_006763 [Cadophora malorum]|uniref:Rhodopsin domain-containing protein n=1 Tax=Cadophora malorum TaxID=108018 RepID=A0A8H7WB91_9HELO|nr:hypothetical protein IFR04_006763 [Cadophora malorum]